MLYKWSGLNLSPWMFTTDDAHQWIDESFSIFDFEMFKLTMQLKEKIGTTIDW